MRFLPHPSISEAPLPKLCWLAAEYGSGVLSLMLEAAEEVILNPIDDVRLQGFYSRQVKGQAKGLVMLLHGWEGSVNSAYILGTGKFLYNKGYSVFRLNYRDHGNSHHLNQGLFYAVLLDEVFNAVRQVSAV